MYSSLLKRCPFCGSFIEMAVYTSCDNEEDKNYGFFCNHCGVHIDFEEKLTYDSDRAEQCKQDATAAWNRRTEEQDTAACPFCGGTIHYVYYPAEDEFENDECDIVCEHCGMHANFYETIEDGTDVRMETERMWKQRDGRDSRGA